MVGKSHHGDAITENVLAVAPEHIHSELERVAARFCAKFAGEPWFVSYGIDSGWSKWYRRHYAIIHLYLRRKPRDVHIPKTRLGAQIKVHVVKGVKPA